MVAGNPGDMAPVHVMVFLSHKPSTENGKYRVAVLVLAWPPNSADVLSAADVKELYPAKKRGI